MRGEKDDPSESLQLALENLSRVQKVEPSKVDLSRAAPETSATIEALQDYMNRPKGTLAQPRAEYLEPFSETADKYIKASDKEGEWTRQTRAQNEATLRLFAGFIRDKNISKVERRDVALFIDEIRDLSPHWGRSPKTKQRTFQEIKRVHGGHPKVYQMPP